MAYWLKLDNCCFCCNLRTGSLFMLWLKLIGCAISLLNVISILVMKHDPEFDSTVRPFLTVHVVYVLVFGFLPSIAGLYGIYKNKPSYLRIYVIVTLVVMVSLLAVALVSILTWIFRDEFIKHLVHELVKQYKRLPNALRYHTSGPTASVGTIFWSAIFIIGILDFIHWYYASVVYSYYIKLQEDTKAAPT